MSGLPLSLSSSVTSLCTAYNDGLVALQQIRAKRKASDLSIEALEVSLSHGESAIRTQYECGHKRFGSAFENGDYLARDAVNNIAVYFRAQVTATLRGRGEQDNPVDYIALQDAADASQDRAIIALMQLQQRMIIMSPTETWISAQPLNTSSVRTRKLPTFQARVQPTSKFANINTSISTKPTADTSVRNESFTLSSTSTVVPNASKCLVTEIPTPAIPRNVLPLRAKATSSPTGHLAPPGAPFPAQPSPRPESSLSRASIESSRTARKEINQYKPMATTVTKGGIFGIGTRTKVEAVVRPPENPLVDEYLADALETVSTRLSRSPSINTMESSIYESAHPTLTTREDVRAPSPALSQNTMDTASSFGSVRPLPTKFARESSASTSSFDSVRRIATIPSITTTASKEVLSSNRSLLSISPHDVLPSEMNQYGGFCKGAWRQQIGDVKRAMEERVRPGGMYNAAKYWQCKQCRFEGRLVPLDKKKSGYDMRVFKLQEGIQFRWEFMFKSHIQSKEVDGNPTKATFGCIFCCAEGKGTPTFCGIKSFMDHLTGHRDRLPSGEVLYRMNCLVGRQAAMDENFDINIVSKR